MALGYSSYIHDVSRYIIDGINFNIIIIMKIYLDFDGTVVEHNYPKIGAPNPNAVDVIKKLKGAGHHIILNTYRSNINDKSLEQSLAYLKHNGINPDEILDKKLNPSPWDWEMFEYNGIVYIDDICDGIPMIRTKFINGGWMVDWQKLDVTFKENGLY